MPPKNTGLVLGQSIYIYIFSRRDYQTVVDIIKAMQNDDENEFRFDVVLVCESSDESTPETCEQNTHFVF